MLENKIKYLQKYFTYFQVLEFFYLNCHKILGPIQVLVNTFLKHDHNDLVLKSMQVKVKK
jgi:hypothetical protein